MMFVGKYQFFSNSYNVSLMVFIIDDFGGRKGNESSILKNEWF